MKNVYRTRHSISFHNLIKRDTKDETEDLLREANGVLAERERHLNVSSHVNKIGQV